MSNFFDILDKYKFGLLAALLAYVGIFAYFQIGTFDKVKELYSPFHDGPMIEIPEEEIMLQPENIMLPANYQPSDVKNAVRDANDKRERSDTDFSTSKDQSKGELSALEYAKKVREQYGTSSSSKQVAKPSQPDQSKDNKDKPKGNEQNNPGGSNKAAAGNVMVEYSVGTRGPHNGNEYNVRNPGYTCGEGSAGKVFMNVKVDAGGMVISAVYDPAKSSGQINPCMIEKAKKYALLSRFNYSPSAPKSESGWIAYTFVSQ